MTIKFRLHGEAKQPVRASEGAAGFDLFSTDRVILPPGQRVLIPTGVSVAIPEGYAGFIWPRSGWAAKQGLDRLAGLIDSDYRGEIHISLINHGFDPVEILKGDRCAQIVFGAVLTDFEVVDELPETERGDNGFGSTGK